MTNTKTFQPKPLFSILLVLAGILIGLLFALLAVWADYEATAYGFLKRANTPLRGLRCPVFIGRNERATVSIKVSNPTDQTISPSVRSELSTPLTTDTKL